jgi:hypothetical protein
MPRTGVLGIIEGRLPQGPFSGVYRPRSTFFNFTSRCPARCAICLESQRKDRVAPYSREQAVDI